MLLRRSILLTTVTLLAVSQTDGQETEESAQDDEYSQYFNAAQAYAESVHRPVINFGSEGQASQPQPHYAPATDFFDTVHDQTRHRRSDNNNNNRNNKPSIVIRIENSREKNKRSNDDEEDVPSYDYAKNIERDSEETRKLAEVGSEKYRPSASDENYNYEEEESPTETEPKYQDVTRQPYNAEYERAVQDIQSSGSEHIPEEIRQSECRPIQSPKHKPDMNCFVCEDPGTKSKFTQCSYAQKHDPVKYYKENTEKFHMDHLPAGAGAALDKRNKRYADKGQDPYDLIRQRTHKSFEEAGHGNIGDYGYEYEPETYEESKGELSYSEMQAEKIKKNPENCQKVDREGMTCMVCKDKSTGGNYESCSYTSTPTEKKYAYVKEKKYDSDQPEEEKEQPKEKTVEVSEESKEQSKKVESTEKPPVQRRPSARQREVERFEDKHRSQQAKSPKKRQNLEATQTQAGINTPQATISEKQETQTASYEEAKKSDSSQQPKQNNQNTPDDDFHSHDHEHKEHFLNPHTSNEAHQPHFHMHHKSDPFGHQHSHQHEDQQQQKQPQRQPRPEATQNEHYAEVHRKEDQTVTYDIPKHFSETIRHGGTADDDHQPHEHKHEEDDHHHGAESKEKQEEAPARGNGGNDFDSYHYKLFPEIAKEEKKNKEREEDYEKDYTHIPTATKQNVEDVLAEFSKKDRSKCKKAQKNGMTCYLCVDKNNIQHEECMYVQESQPKSSHVAYHGVKKKSPEEIEKEKQKQEQEKQAQQEDGDEYNENGDQQQDKSPEASAPQPQTAVAAASETHETVVRYNPKFAHMVAEPQMEAAASEMHETVIGYNRETGEPIIGAIDLDQAPRGAEDTVVRYDEETGEPRLVPAESENQQQQGVRYDEETGEKIPPGKVKKRRKVPKKATEGKGAYYMPL
nr:unnamed protein product [Callosobruchus chinensis]